MASIQCTKPVQKTTMVCQKTTTTATETCHTTNGHKEHNSFTDKVKEAAHSATKIFEHKNPQNSGQHCHLTQKPHNAAATATITTTHCSAHKKEEGHGGFLHNLGEQIKHLTSPSKKKKNHRKNRPAGGCNDSSGGSSSSSDESDNETTCDKKD